MECERQAGTWRAAFRSQAPQVGQEPPLLRRELGLTRRSSYEEAMQLLRHAAETPEGALQTPEEHLHGLALEERSHNRRE